ncbi:fibroblast growth factor [Nephila pilipes]|uniref:Fibroblast growth factor n=1 Tax=Nephila pilipes TaxID=299642 RepID=A0A8X6QR26_NEPPI|nr:fibroblast growth factor [Nephila pilipes]
MMKEIKLADHTMLGHCRKCFLTASLNPDFTKGLSCGIMKSDPESENTWFKEVYEDGWNNYIWLGNQKEWYLGIKKSGKMKRGHRTRRGQNAVKFVPRSAEPSYN